MLGIVFALIAFFGWAIGDIFGTFATRRLGSFATSAWGMAAGILTAGLFIPFVHRNIIQFTAEILIINIFLGLVFIIGLICFNEGLRVGNPSVVGTISASFTAVVVVLSIIFLKEQINFNQILAIILIFLGVILSGFDLGFKKDKGKFRKGIIYALITMISWGVYYAFIKLPVEQIGWFWPQMITLSLFPLIFYFIRKRKGGISIPSYKDSSLFLVVMNGILVGGGEFAYNFAISHGYVAIVAPIAGSYPVLFVILASLFFKEQITRKQKYGILTTLLGIVFLSILSI